MCVKVGNSELDSVRALMTMSLNAVVAEVFGLELDAITPELKVFSDLGMTPGQQAEFSALVADYFDGVQLRFEPATTLGDIFDHVIEQEFADLPSGAG